jgi:hypothetical protein
MSDDFALTLTGDRAVELMLARIPDAVRARLVPAIRDLTDRAYALYVAGEPSRTGRLHGETREVMTDQANLVRGRVTIVASGGGSQNEYAKAGALEYGAHGRTKVAAHVRDGHDWFGHPVEQLVKAYTRQVDILAYRFARNALEAISAEAQASLRAAVESVVAAEG